MRGFIGGLAVVCALMVAGMSVAGLVSWNLIAVGATGTPLDSAGASPPCPRCDHPYTRGVSRYGYVCQKCGWEFACRTDERNRFVYE